MAIIAPSPHLKHIRITSGERRLAARLMTKLEDDYRCWFDVPVGRKQSHPDFIVLHPGRGILVLEVKDWKLDTLCSMDSKTAEINTDRGPKTVPNPLEQARQYALQIKELLERDPLLTQQEDGRYKGALLFPWGYGVVFTNISRSRFLEAQLDQAIEPHLVLCQDEMLEDADPEVFQQRLWGMFKYSFGGVLSLARVDRIRWHLFPEIRIDQGNLFTPTEEAPDAGQNIARMLPDIVRVMDSQQELLARNLGDGHRVIHGVAGSGKTLILAYRCLHLAELKLGKPILVLCYNRTLAARLRQMLSERGGGDGVHIYNFHQWCREQLNLYQIDVPPTQDGQDAYSLQVEALIRGVEKGAVPRAQYAALLIDEGHDFKPDWFSLVVQMIDPHTNSLLLMYDSAQSIYDRRRKFPSWASMGIQAQGRTTVLKVNYRNTVELLTFAYTFVREFLGEAGGEGEIPVVLPEVAGRHGLMPEIAKCRNFEDEVERVAEWLKARYAAGVAYKDMAVIYRKRFQAEKMEQGLRRREIPVDWVTRTTQSRNSDLAAESIKLITMHSSKGLEFDSVAIPDLGGMPHPQEDPAQEARLLYVALTRATENALLTWHSESEFTRKLAGAGAAPAASR